MYVCMHACVCACVCIHIHVFGRVVMEPGCFEVREDAILGSVSLITTFSISLLVFSVAA